MTAAGTFPTDATDQQVQANVVAAAYKVFPLRIAPASASSAPPGLQTFSPRSSRDATVTFTNTTDAPAANLKLSISLPGKQWSAVVQGSTEVSKTFADPVSPDASVSATFKVTSGLAALNGDLVANATWTNQATGQTQFETTAEKVRNVSPVKINEFRISSGSANATDSFMELYNAGPQSVDLSNWTLTEHPAQQAIFSTIKLPAGTKLAAGGFYLIGLSNSGLAVPANRGDNIIHVRSTTGMSVGDPVSIDTGSSAETRKIAGLGAAAGNHTTVWQPLPDGPIITIPAGSTNVPVMSVSGFAIGEKIALGYGATYPSVAGDVERYEVTTVIALGKPGMQAYLATDAPAGTTNIKVSSVADISVGDKIRLDIDSVGHGIEEVTVTNVGTAAVRTNLAAYAGAGATNIKVRNVNGFVVGDKLTIGTPGHQQTVTITDVGSAGPRGRGIDFSPALELAHIDDEGIVVPGTGLDLAAALRFNHSANLPFSSRGTGISFQPATKFAHSSNEPVQALGTGITLDGPLSKGHAINAVVRDAAVTNAGYQPTPAPDQWFGGPELTTNSPLFGRIISLKEGSMVLRDDAGLVVDSLNYGGLVDPWAAEGYQSKAGFEQSGCYAPIPGPIGATGQAAATEQSTGRFPDGADTDSNCGDFLTQAAATLSAASTDEATNIKVSNVDRFEAGEKIMIDSGANLETAVIAIVGTAGGTKLATATDAGQTVIPVGNVIGFREGQTITVDAGDNSENAVIASIRRFSGPAIGLTSPLSRAHTAGAQVSGSGITLASALTRSHASGARILDNGPTPGASNRYNGKTH